MFPFGKSPFKENGFGKMIMKDIDQYVQQVLSNAMGQSFPQYMKENDFFKHAHQMYNQPLSSEQQRGPLTSNVFQTHDECIVQLSFPKPDKVEEIKVAYTPYSCTITGTYDGEDFTEECQLPCTVSRKGSKATCRNGILEVKLIKYTNLPETEIDVHHFD